MKDMHSDSSDPRARGFQGGNPRQAFHPILHVASMGCILHSQYAMTIMAFPGSAGRWNGKDEALYFIGRR